MSKSNFELEPANNAPIKLPAVVVDWHNQFPTTPANITLSLPQNNFRNSVNASYEAVIESVVTNRRTQMYLFETVLSPNQIKNNKDLSLLSGAVALAKVHKMEKIYGHSSSRHTIETLGKLLTEEHVVFDYRSPDGMIELPITLSQAAESLHRENNINAIRTEKNWKDKIVGLSYSIKLDVPNMKAKLKKPKEININSKKKKATTSMF